MDKDQATKDLEYLRGLSYTLNINSVANPILTNPDFFIGSGASKPEQHHYGDYGLIVHTAEVVRLSQENGAKFGIDKSDMFLAALFHDVGKMYDYAKVDGVWGATPHKRNIHHISKSAILFNQCAWRLSEDKRDEITHAILAHHGLREYGSPVAPNSRLAWMLHLCDNMSARMFDVGKWDFLK